MQSKIRSLIESRDRSAELRSIERKYGVFGSVEQRTFRHSVSEMRKAGTSDTGATDGSLQVVGHAAVFGQPSVEMRSPMGIFTEYIDGRAFDSVLKRNPDVLLTWDHSTRHVLGRTGNQTLDLSVDKDGLRYWSRVADTSYARDLNVLMEGNYLNQSSFLFRIAPGGEDWEIVDDEQGNEIVKRTIFEVSDLFDVCVTASGAYPQTDSGIMRTVALDYATESGFVQPRTVIYFSETPTAEKDLTWELRSALGTATTEDLMDTSAWYDPEKRDTDGNLEKVAFKLIHHLPDEARTVSWNGVKAAMERLNKSTGIPDSQRNAVYTHLRKHFDQFDEVAPELRSRGEIELEIKTTTDELRALGEVAWGPEEGTSDLVCDVECQLNENSYFDLFSVVDISVDKTKVIVCDWDDFSFWVVPVTVSDDGVTVSDMSEWVQVETAWVTTSEGYEAKMRTAKDRRTASQSEETVETTDQPASGAKERLIQEARVKISRAKLG